MDFSIGDSTKFNMHPLHNGFQPRCEKMKTGNRRTFGGCDRSPGGQAGPLGNFESYSVSRGLAVCTRVFFTTVFCVEGLESGWGLAATA